MASSYTWQAGEVFEADCTAKLSCKKKPVLHIRKKKKKKSSEQDDEIITSNRDISALWLVFLLVYERRNLT